MARRRTTIFASLALLGLIAGACGSDDKKDTGGGGSSDTSAVAAKDGGEFVFGLEAEADGLSPTHSSFAVTGHLVASAVFDPLASFDKDSNVVPFLAESIEPSEDMKTWTIQLREGVTFHDDTPLDADVVVANLKAHQASALTGAAFSDVDTVTASGPLTVTVTTKQPWASFPYILTSQVGYVQAASMIEQGAAAKDAPVGTGPFVYESSAPGDNWIGVRNEAYWREGLPHLDRIEFRVVPDDMTRDEALSLGDLDMTHTDYAPSIPTFQENEAVQLFIDSEGEEEFIMLNLGKEPFNSLTARKAVAYATDAELYGTTIGEGILEPIGGPFAQDQLGFMEDTGYPEYDLAEATKLVDQYEKETGKKLAFELSSVPTPQGLLEIQLLADMWKDAGMDVTIYTSEQAAHILRVITGGYQAAYWRLFSAVDPDGDYVWWHGKNAVDPPGMSLNFARNRDTDLDAALDEARQTSDPDVRDAAYQKVSQRMAEDLPYIWLSRVTWLYAAQPHVKGLENIMGGGLGSVAAKTWIGEIWLDS